MTGENGEEKDPDDVDSPKNRGSASRKPRRYYGTVVWDSHRVGRDASRIAEEEIAHLVGQVSAEVTVTLKINASLPEGASEQIVRKGTENARTLKFTNQAFEGE